MDWVGAEESSIIYLWSKYCNESADLTLDAIEEVIDKFLVNSGEYSYNPDKQFCVQWQVELRVTEISVSDDYYDKESAVMQQDLLDETDRIRKEDFDMVVGEDNDFENKEELRLCEDMGINVPPSELD